MAHTKMETERKYEAPPTGDTSWLAELTGVGGIASVQEEGTDELDAVYYDTEDLRLAGASVTLRRRTGGSDAGWHLKLPGSGDSREEIQAPLSDAIPDPLRDLALSRTRGAELRPVVRIRSTRGTRHLVDSDGALLAELTVDRVRAEPSSVTTTCAEWTEMEVELAEDADPSLLDVVDKTLSKSGIGRAAGPSKLARALEETGVGAPRLPDMRTEAVTPGSAGEQFLTYVDEQVRALVDLDAAVRRDLPDAVHKMRVTCRRLRSTLRSYRSVLAREVTDPIREELKWLGGELGAARDHEVLMDRLGSRIDALPPELILGPVDARLQVWNVARTVKARERTLDALHSPRYLALLESLTLLTEQPPLRRKAASKPRKMMAKAVLKEYERLSVRMTHALELSPGTERDVALHQARKAAKKTRYATEPARASLGNPAKRLGKRVKRVQKVLGDHQDSVVARDALRELAVAAHTAGEGGFTWGLLYGHEQATAAGRERELPGAWADASKPKLRKKLAD
ncbi:MULTISPECIES: CYTH and CHAD domain-containing protein [unclassified Streptomyces]|uniref:CYTH and CHAD domain-containing protein n=1 Tax=unclassified Streptomyces TaxID=2593676 RepID=UPI002256E7A9|nr:MULTISPECIES: CYTH and CHAD domain-containing protein [unclassified Streptomyces]MCX5053934.1 CYTH and CHAD domain-containing protein [Streptomyces sp. NBC_00474]